MKSGKRRCIDGPYIPRYLDTSVVVKRDRTEDGTEYMDYIFEYCAARKEHALITSTLTVLECIAALRRARKGKVITKRHFQNATYHFAQDISFLSLRPLTEDILVNAIDIVMEYALWTADAIHVATAIELRAMMSMVNDEVRMITTDIEMCDVARSEDVIVMNARDDNIARLRSLFGE